MATKKPTNSSVLDELATFNMGIAAGLGQSSASGKAAQRIHRNSLGDAFSPRDADGGMAALADEPLLEMSDRAMGVTPVNEEPTQQQRGGSTVVKGKSATQLPVSRLPLRKPALSQPAHKQAGKGQDKAASPAKSPIDPSMAPGFSWDGVKIGPSSGGMQGASGTTLLAPQGRRLQGGTGAFTATAASTGAGGKVAKGGLALSPPPGRGVGSASSGGDYLPSGTLAGGVGVQAGLGHEDLLARLEAKDKEIERLEAVLLAVEPSPGLQPAKLLEADRAGQGGRGVGAGVDPRDAKLLELAKRNRELSRQVSREAERAAKALAEGSRWKAAHAAASERERDMRERLAQGREGQEGSTAAVDSSAAPVPDLAPALRIAQANLTKAVRERDRAMAEVKAIHKIVRKEVGPEVHLGKLLAAHGVTHSMVLGSEGQQGGEGQSEEGPVGEGSEAIAPGQWRGRAQTIALLRAKVKELERQMGARQGQQGLVRVPASSTTTPALGTAGSAQALAAHGGAGSDPSATLPQPTATAAGGGPSDAEFGLGLEDDAERAADAGSMGMGGDVGQVGGGGAFQPLGLAATGTGTGQGFDVDDRAAATVVAREGVRAKQLDASKAESAALRAERDKWKGEAAAARARGQVLDAELKKLKGHLRALLSKGETDDKLIAGLKGEIEGLKGALEKVRSKGAVAALLGVPASALQGGGEAEGAGEVAAARREAEEARRQTMAAERTVASLRKALRSLRDVLEANGIEPPMDSVQLATALGPQGVTAQQTGGSKFKMLMRQASDQQFGGGGGGGGGGAGEEHGPRGGAYSDDWSAHHHQQQQQQQQQQGGIPLSKPRAVYSSGMTT